MGFLFRLYVQRLKSRPIATNLGTAVVLMTAGDVMAQVIEQWHLEDKFTLHDPSDLEGVPVRRRLHLRPYWTRQPDDDEEDGGAEKGAEKDADEEGPNRRELLSAAMSSALDEALTAAESVRRDVAHTVDWTRTTSMSVWAVSFYTPAYMWLYYVYDKIFPKKTTFTVSARVLGSVLYSIPVNVAFFLYGTCVHHTLEWLDLWEERRDDAEEEELWATVALAETDADDDGDDNEEEKEMENGDDEEEEVENGAAGVISKRERRKRRLESIRRLFLPLPPTPRDPPPYDTEMMLSKARLKIETELITTVKNSAQMWIPINLFNFAVVPTHLRPFGLLFFSVFWNCYLSLVQHRDLPLPEVDGSEIEEEARKEDKHSPEAVSPKGR